MVTGKLGWRLAGGSLQPGTPISSHTDSFFTLRAQVQTANWRQINLGLKRKLIGCYKTCIEVCPQEETQVQLILRGVNSMDKPNGRLVLVSYMHYCTSTSSLSTRWSSWALHFPYGLGDLILERASRLYAFSGYHNRTSLPSRALGRTTGTQEVRPSRSSRTKDSPLQISYAHSR